MSKLFFLAVSMILISASLASAADLCVVTKESGELTTNWYELRCTGGDNASIPVASFNGKFYWNSKKNQALALDNLKKLMDGKGYVQVDAWPYQVPFFLYQKSDEVKPGSSFCLVEKSGTNISEAWETRPVVTYKIDCNNGGTNTMTGLDENQGLDGINAYMAKTGFQPLANLDPMYNTSDKFARLLVFGSSN